MKKKTSFKKVMKILLGSEKKWMETKVDKVFIYLFVCLFVCFLDEVNVFLGLIFLWMNQRNISVPLSIRTHMSTPTAIFSLDYGIIQKTFCARPKT